MDSPESLQRPVEAHTVKNAHVIMIQGQPCKVLEVHHSTTGKHGHLKCTWVGISLWNGKKYTDMKAGHQLVYAVNVLKQEFVLAFLEDEILHLLDVNGEQIEETVQTTDPIHAQLVKHQDDAQRGNKQVYVTRVALPVDRKVCT